MLFDHFEAFKQFPPRFSVLLVPHLYKTLNPIVSILLRILNPPYQQFTEVPSPQAFTAADVCLFC